MKKIQLKIETLNTTVSSLYVRFITKLLLVNNISVSKVFLPKIKKRMTFQKSPHVFKKSKEHFELKKNKVLLNFKANPKILKLLALNKPNTVKVKFICN